MASRHATHLLLLILFGLLAGSAITRPLSRHLKGQARATCDPTATPKIVVDLGALPEQVFYEGDHIAIKVTFTRDEGSATGFVIRDHLSSDLKCVHLEVLEGPNKGVPSGAKCDNDGVEFPAFDFDCTVDKVVALYVVQVLGVWQVTHQTQAAFMGPSGNLTVDAPERPMRVEDYPQGGKDKCRPESLVNADFESPRVLGIESSVWHGQYPGWKTTAAGDSIEVWRSGHLGVDAAAGDQLVVLPGSATLFQDLRLRTGVIMWSLRHRGRQGNAKVIVAVGPDTKPETQLEEESTSEKWQTYSGIYRVPKGQRTTRLAITSPAGDSFLDNAMLWQTSLTISTVIESPDTDVHVGDRIRLITTVKKNGPEANALVVEEKLPNGFKCTLDPAEVVKGPGKGQVVSCKDGAVKFDAVDLPCGKETLEVEYIVEASNEGDAVLKPSVDFSNPLGHFKVDAEEEVVKVVKPPQPQTEDCEPNLVVNGGFEFPRAPPKYSGAWKNGGVPGWRALPDDGLLVLWSDKHGGVDAPVGKQFIALQPGVVASQEFKVVEGMTMVWKARHSGHGGAPSIRLSLKSSSNDTNLGVFVPQQATWDEAGGNFKVPAGEKSLRLAIEADASGMEVGLVDEVQVVTASGLGRLETNATTSVAVGDRVSFTATFATLGLDMKNIVVKHALPDGLRCVVDSLEVVEGPNKGTAGSCKDDIVVFPSVNLTCPEKTLVVTYVVEVVEVKKDIEVEAEISNDNQFGSFSFPVKAILGSSTTTTTTAATTSLPSSSTTDSDKEGHIIESTQKDEDTFQSSTSEVHIATSSRHASTSLAKGGGIAIGVAVGGVGILAKLIYDNYLVNRNLAEARRQSSLGGGSWGSV